MIPSNTEKRVAFIFSGLYVGGAEKFGITLANQFAHADIPTFFYLFEKIDSPYYQLIDPRITVIHMERRSRFSIRLHQKFDESLNSNGITDAFYFCLKPLLYTRFQSRAVTTKTRFFVTLHSTIPVNLKESIKTNILFRFVRKTDTTVFICRNQREYIKTRYDFVPEKNAVIYNGVDTDHFNPATSEAGSSKRTDLGIPRDARVILLVATLRPEKGHADALKALKLLTEKYPIHENTHLVCVGGGNTAYRDKLIEMSIELGIEKKVHWAGNHKDVRPFYALADMFTLTSVSVETFSIAALEAMSYGLPISLTNIGGASEMIFGEINGSLSRAGSPESIAESWRILLERSPDKTAIRQIALSHFSITKTYNAYKALIENG